MPLTKYIWDIENDSLLAEADEAGAATAVYTNEGAALISQWGGGAVHVFHFDGQQSVRQLTDTIGQIIEDYVYAAFGENVMTAAGLANAFRYQGAVGYYTNTDLENLTAGPRTYGPRLGRWLAPIDIRLHVNRYSLHRNNPVNSRRRGMASRTATHRSPRSDNLIASGLGAEEISRKFTGECGGAEWSIRWCLHASQRGKDGAIVQHIQVDVTVYDCCGRLKKRSVQTRDRLDQGETVNRCPSAYWEAWLVWDGAPYAEDPLSPFPSNEPPIDKYSNPDEGNCSTGKVRIRGRAKFIELTDVSGYFKNWDYGVTGTGSDGAPLCAGILPSNLTKPQKWSDADTFTHDMTVRWDCCGRRRSRELTTAMSLTSVCGASIRPQGPSRTRSGMAAPVVCCSEGIR